MDGAEDSDTRLLNVRTEYQNLTTSEIREIYLHDMNQDMVMCLNLTGEFNIGCIVRTASLFGMGKVIIIGRRIYDKRTTVGMHLYIPVERITASDRENIELDVDKIQKVLEGYMQTHQIVFVEHGGYDLRTIHEHTNHAKPVLFVMGPEGGGIPAQLLAMKGTQIVSISQLGIGRSFNVSSAFAMIAYEYYRVV